MAGGDQGAIPIQGLRQQVQAKGYVLNGYYQMPGTFSAELYARQGWDAVTLDLQHGLIGYDMAVTMLQAMSATGVLPLARVPWLEPSIIMKLLDAGALGVTCPMISTADDAERLAQRGFQFLTMSSDLQALAGQSRQWVEGCRKLCSVPPAQ